MSWLYVFALALAAFAAMALVFRVPRSVWTALGAALLLGLAGYAAQASPDLAGAPKQAAERMSADPAAAMAARDLLDESDIPPTNQWIVIADGMARNGQFADAAQVLLGALDQDPRNANAWLALGNALVAHADGLLTPAASYAYERSRRAAPESPGPAYFLGLALAQSGRFAEARETWAGLLRRSPADAPYRELLAGQLLRLDRLIAAQAAGTAGR